MASQTGDELPVCVQRQLRVLAAFRDGWNDGDGSSPRPEAPASTEALLRRLGARRLLAQPFFLGPDIDGEVLVQWPRHNFGVVVDGKTLHVYAPRGREGDKPLRTIVCMFDELVAPRRS